MIYVFNTQVGLAVGDIQQERDKAVLTKFYLQVITCSSGFIYLYHSQVDLALSLEELFTLSRRFWYKNSDKFYPTRSGLLQAFQAIFTTTFKRKLECIRMVERAEDPRDHHMGVPVRSLYYFTLPYNGNFDDSSHQQLWQHKLWQIAWHHYYKSAYLHGVAIVVKVRQIHSNYSNLSKFPIVQYQRLTLYLPIPLT